MTLNKNEFRAVMTQVGGKSRFTQNHIRFVARRVPPEMERSHPHTFSLIIRKISQLVFLSSNLAYFRAEIFCEDIFLHETVQERKCMWQGTCDL